MKQVSDKETMTILQLAEDCLSSEGDFVELGCFEGDTSLLLAEVLKNNNSKKRLWIYDSFEGLPEKTENDFSELGRDFKKGELFTTKRFVKQRFLRANLPVPRIKKAWFSELKNDDLPEKIAFAFLDGDLYDSIRDSLNLVFPKLNENGKIVVHDYNNPQLPGVSKAVDEFLEKSDWNLKTTLSLAILSKRS
ncbi:class I SAM-dependent methyltransferase [Candidatus Saccharibacteria bacterium]|nr:class I SAM-dependent methyltransferase [Candidatus Saccharibacteria bacterium]